MKKALCSKCKKEIEKNENKFTFFCFDKHSLTSEIVELWKKDVCCD